MENDRLHITIDSDLKEDFNVKCLRNRTNMSDVLRDLIREYVYEGID